MDYKRIYTELMTSAKERIAPEGYVENHHIIPRCLIQDDSKENNVTLTAREHFVAHWLLTKIYKGTKYEILLLRAFTAMNMKNSIQERVFNGNRDKALAFAYSKSVKGSNNPMYGSVPSNLGKNGWYLPEEDIYLFSDKAPSVTARRGMKYRDTGVALLSGKNNGMHGVNLTEILSEEASKSMMEKRKATYALKSKEERGVINKARGHGYEFNIKGTYYPCLSVVSSSLGFSHKTITKRCLSDLPEFKEWTRQPRLTKYIP